MPTEPTTTTTTTTTTTPPSTKTCTNTYTIRLARDDDVPKLAAIERSAGQLFRSVGLDAIADDEPMPVEVLRCYLAKGNLWVAVSVGGKDGGEVNGGEGGRAGVVVAFLAVFPITKEGATRSADETVLHIAELSVHEDWQRRGIARGLLANLEDVARGRERLRNGGGDKDTGKTGRDGVVGLSLTTYRDVPFNRPFYAKMGFEDVETGEIENVVGKRGRELWEEEQETITTGRERRCWMVKWLKGT